MAIQQHPVPQDISNYRFRLIGDMTIRQFVSLGIFIILSVLIYGAPIPFFFRYPLAFIFLITGIAMAFVPIQGRTLDIWIVAFIKSIYSPTQYVWRSSPDSSDTGTASSVSNDISTTPQTPIVPLTPPAAEPVVETSATEIPFTETPITDQPTNRQTDPVSIPTEQIAELADSPQEVLTQLTTPLPPITEVPVTETPINMHAEATPQTPIAESPQPIKPLSTPPPTVTLPIPFTPTTPNVIVGLTLTPDEHILDGVLIEIKKDNLTVRATKSNKLGQFLFARALEDGLYQILAEKDGFNFTPYALELNGEIVRPLKSKPELYEQ